MTAVTIELTNLANGCEASGDNLAASICRNAIKEIERVSLLPIRVFCTASDVPNGRQLIARVANVNDVKLLQQNYNFCLTWNMDK